MTLALLVQDLEKVFCDLISNVVDMSTTASCSDGVDERHLLESSVRDSEADLPSRMALVLIHFYGAGWSTALFVATLLCDRLGVQITVGLEVLDLDLLVVEIIIYAILHTKALEVGLESNSGEVGTFAAGDLGLVHCLHVVGPGLLVPLAMLTVLALEIEFSTEDVAQFGTVTVTATNGLLLVVVEVGTRQQMSEDKLRDVDLLLLVNLNRNTLSVILNADHTLRTVDVDFHVIHGRIALLVIGSVNQDLVKDLVETRDEVDSLVFHLFTLLVQDPHLLLCPFHRADVCVRSQENVIKLGELGVRFGGCLGFTGLGGFGGAVDVHVVVLDLIQNGSGGFAGCRIEVAGKAGCGFEEMLD
ncbi:hypothetical protein HG530_010214 [Fusarium avenaceum]|nr:hypothetical protein HG530_010214 [Fusarium avenaceum]